MKNIFKIAMLALALGAQTAGAQSLQPTEDAQKGTVLMLSKDTVEVNYAAGFGNVAIFSNASDYTVTKGTDADWLTYRKEANGNLTFFSSYYNDNMNPRYGTLTISTPDGSVSRTLVVKQTVNTSAEDVETNTSIKIASAQASSSQSGQGIEKSYDGDTSTLWHSVWSGGSFPFTATYTFAEASHLDYFIYTPRTDGSANGRWGEISVSYALDSAPNSFVPMGTADFGKSSAASTYTFGDEGIDNVLKVRIEITSAGSDGSSAYASCAEIAFYANNPTTDADIDAYFESPLCYALKDGVTADDIAGISSPYLRQLAGTLLEGDYSTEYRVGEFECYLTRTTLQSQLKTSQAYDIYENPTGIYFNEGDNIVVFAEGISSKYPVQLIIKNFSSSSKISSEGQPESYYSLTNGMNSIKASNRGNAYVYYFSDDYENAPTVKLHFALANEVGYFDSRKNMTNTQWQKILSNAKTVGADIIDVITKRMHVAAPYSNLYSKCPNSGVKLAEVYDSIVALEREIMGLQYYNIEPKNHQFARPVSSGMYADGTGAAAAFGSFDGWVSPSSFDFWGLGHELGHINQISPGFKWTGCGETTNNIYSAWVQHRLGAVGDYGDGTHRLEDEISGIDTYSSTRGGRFEAYLEEGVRKGVSWQLQDGPDYHGTEASTVTVTGQDENGNSTGSVTTTSRNYDHFVKVIPFWQLTLYTQEVGASPNAFGKLIQTYRDGFNTSTFNTNGKQQIEMMRRFCEVTEINFLPFFEKAGMLKPINAYIEDYSAGWNIITQDMCDALEAEIEAKGYAEAPAALNYINAYNWQIFRDKTPLITTKSVNSDCSLSGTKVRVKNSEWTGAVGYETYDSSGNLLHISMYGLGDSQRSSTYTYVLFPATAYYIMAVGYDGTKVKCYQR